MLGLAVVGGGVTPPLDITILELETDVQQTSKDRQLWTEPTRSFFRRHAGASRHLLYPQSHRLSSGDNYLPGSTLCALLFIRIRVSNGPWPDFDIRHAHDGKAGAYVSLSKWLSQDVLSSGRQKIPRPHPYGYRLGTHCMVDIADTGR